MRPNAHNTKHMNHRGHRGTQRKIADPIEKAAFFRRLPERTVSFAQLFSLLARFQEISSPMVELVLETGCL
jgi:hypothetical protein